MSALCGHTIIIHPFLYIAAYTHSQEEKSEDLNSILRLGLSIITINTVYVGIVDKSTMTILVSCI